MLHVIVKNNVSLTDHELRVVTVFIETSSPTMYDHLRPYAVLHTSIVWGHVLYKHT